MLLLHCHLHRLTSVGFLHYCLENNSALLKEEAKIAVTYSLSFFYYSI